eukprot:m51a1_g14737 hypothetical protein (214) ;mRNA; r:257641-276397
MKLQGQQLDSNIRRRASDSGHTHEVLCYLHALVRVIDRRFVWGAACPDIGIIDGADDDDDEDIVVRPTAYAVESFSDVGMPSNTVVWGVARELWPYDDVFIAVVVRAVDDADLAGSQATASCQLYSAVAATGAAAANEFQCFAQMGCTPATLAAGRSISSTVVRAGDDECAALCLSTASCSAYTLLRKLLKSIVFSSSSHQVNRQGILAVQFH